MAKKPKINWQWLKDSNNEVSYARVVGTISIFSNLLWRFFMGVDGINSWPSAAAGCIGCITGVALWLIELFRENKQVSVRFGDKQYSAKIGFTTEAIGVNDETA